MFSFPVFFDSNEDRNISQVMLSEQSFEVCGSISHSQALSFIKCLITNPHYVFYGLFGKYNSFEISERRPFELPANFDCSLLPCQEEDAHNGSGWDLCVAAPETLCLDRSTLFMLSPSLRVRVIPPERVFDFGITPVRESGVDPILGVSLKGICQVDWVAICLPFPQLQKIQCCFFPYLLLRSHFARTDGLNLSPLSSSDHCIFFEFNHKSLLDSKSPVSTTTTS